MPIHHFEWSYLVTATFGSLSLGDNCSSLRGTHTAEITLRHFLCRDGSTRGKAINRAIKHLANHISFFSLISDLCHSPVPLKTSKERPCSLEFPQVGRGWDWALTPTPDPHSTSAWAGWTWLGYCKQNQWPFPFLRAKGQQWSLRPLPCFLLLPSTRLVLQVINQYFQKTLDQASWLCGFIRKFCRIDIETVSHAEGFINCICR